MIQKDMLPNYQFPSYKISGETLQNVNIFKYLGHLISNDLYDDDDIVRQMGLLYGRTITSYAGNSQTAAWR